MGSLATKQAVSLNEGSRALQTTKLAVDALTSEVKVRLRRPTTLEPLAWDQSGVLRVTLVVVIDGQEHRCTGQVSGGIRAKSDGTEATEYTLTYNPTVINDKGTIKRIGETAKTECAAYVILERLAGSIETELLSAETKEDLAPQIEVVG